MGNMSTVWGRDESGWKALAPSGFPDEAALHDLVEDAPQLLPLSGRPQLIVLGREVQLGPGRADLLAVEPDGRIAIVEVKLRANPEARRAIVSQILSYAAYLQGMTIDTMESSVLAGHLRDRGYASITDAVMSNFQQGSFDVEAFAENLESNLSAGAFRLVLVLDEAPDELALVAGFLESIAPDLHIDLVTVYAYDVDGSVFMVPRRVDPGRVERSLPTQTSERVTGSLSPGADDFEASIVDASGDQRPRFELLVRFARGLEDRGLASLATYHAVRPGQLTLLPRLKDTGAGLITIWNDGGNASLAFWRSALEARAPVALTELEGVSPVPVGQGTRTNSITPELLDVLEKAYEEATTTHARRIDLDQVRELVAKIPRGRWLSYADLAEVAGGTRASGLTIGRFLSTDQLVSSASVHRVLLEDGSVSPNWRGGLGGPEDCRRELESEGITFVDGRAEAQARIAVKEL
jgi:alkylated DNA nucleotide flippase Atl1